MEEAKDTDEKGGIETYWGGGASRIKLCAELVELTFLPVRGAASPLAGGSALVLLQREEERKAKEMSRDGC